MRTILILFVFLLPFLVGCAGGGLFSRSEGNKYQYRFVMTSPEYSEKMVYRDSSIYAQFRFDDGAIRFQIQNITTQNMEIDWGRMTMGIRGKFWPVRNSATLYSAATPCHAGTVMPPLGYTIDFAIPEKSITPQDGWHERDLLPTVDEKSPATRDKIMKSVGTPITLMMPLRIGSTIREYTFTFKVAGVNEIPWAQAKDPRRPTPPRKEQQIYASDQYITAGIVAVVVGVASILVSQKKDEPSE